MADRTKEVTKEIELQTKVEASQEVAKTIAGSFSVSKKREDVCVTLSPEN